MSAVVADISMSLDGYVTGPDPDVEHGLGRGGEAIQQWVFQSHSSQQDRSVLEASASSTGGVLMGRRTFTFITGGVASAVAAARDAAGERETVLMGGAEVIDQALSAGLVDLLRDDVVVTPYATHLTYRINQVGENQP